MARRMNPMPEPRDRSTGHALGPIADIASWMSIGTVALACVISGFGVQRMPDLLARMHAASVADTGGVLLILNGLMV